MEEDKKKRIYQVEIALVVVLVLVSIVSFLPNSGITGFVSIETKMQPINLTLANSKSYILTTENSEFTLLSLKVSGEVIGPGIAMIYIDDGQNEHLIYSNVEDKKTGGMAITGFGRLTGNAINIEDGTVEPDYLVLDYLEDLNVQFDTIGEDKRAVSGTFLEECQDTCYIEMLMNKDTAYQLKFFIEKGTILKVNEIVYSVRED